ncbi:bifunctional 2-polyprenyl-6-hydroxyphenol methylase/3-demethylubiquinol 3-O-methyltransferase UbiG [Rickettsiales bacterium LUAb2]
MAFAKNSKNTTNQFDSLSKDWWNKEGNFKLLHMYNALRVPYLKNVINQYFTKLNKPITNLKLLDVGCGGGLLSEEFAKLGIKVTGIDTSREAIKTASSHASSQNLSINYLNQELSTLDTQEKFDIVLVMEILEHVDNLPQFIKQVMNYISDDGIIFFSTINRNLKSLLLAKVAAEYILRWLPKGIHEYNKFIKPFELDNLFQTHNFFIRELKGVNYSVLHNKWEINNIPKINYMGYATK